MTAATFLAAVAPYAEISAVAALIASLATPAIGFWLKHRRHRPEKDDSHVGL